MESVIQFDVLSDTQIKSMSVFKDTTDDIIISDIYDKMEPKKAGLAICSCKYTTTIICQTCGLDSMACLGHSGGNMQD